MNDYLNLIVKNKDLDFEFSKDLASKFASGDFSCEKASGILTALRMKIECSSEISGFAHVFRNKAKKIFISGDLTDCCGTGGDNLNTFNISTAVSFVLAGAGIKIAKHGNKKVSSKSGSLDVLKILNIPVDLEENDIKKHINLFGFAFIYAPLFHSAFKNIADIRNNLGIRTIFNLLGPLINPANVKRQIIGLFDKKYIDVIAESLIYLGIKEAMIFSSDDKMDELSIFDKNHIAHIKNSNIEKYVLDPKKIGFKKGSLSELKVKDAKESADMIMSVLKGDLGSHRDIVALNAAAGLLINNKVKSIEEGVIFANEVIDSKKPLNIIENISKFNG